MLHRSDQDLAFWLATAHRVGGPVLELACGTGRLTLGLATAGVPIVGLDNDPVMLAAAMRRRDQLTAVPGVPAVALFVAADMRRFALARRFGLVFVGYNSLQLLCGPGDMVRCLDQARRHLAPGGLIGLEVTDFQVGGADGASDEPMVLAEAEGIRLSGTLAHDLQARTSLYRRHFEGEGWAVDDQIRVRSLDAAELKSVVAQAGLRLVWTWAAGTMVRAVAEQ